MDLNATIDLIIKDLDDAREIIDDLKKYPGVPALQVELAKSKCKSSSELISMLKTVSENIQTVKSSTLHAPHSPQDQLQPQAQPEPQPEPDPEPEPQPQPHSQSETQPETQPHLQDSYIVADNFSHLSGRFNEQIGGLLRDEDALDFNKTKHVAHLTEAIGVNDRFLFIREIFNDNHEAYSQAIDRLDNAENLADAKAVVMSYTGVNKENEALKQLLELVKRKLSSHE